MGPKTENGSSNSLLNITTTKMVFKIVVLSCLVAVASAGIIPTGQLTYSAPITYTSHAVQAPITYAAPITKYAAPVQYAAPIAKEVAVAPAPAKYSFSYDVQDGHTGDSKSAYETRDGDVVHGAYSLVDPDGTKRTVEYTADAHHGFNAVVHKEPYAVKVVAPVAKIAAPIAYSAAPVVHSAPVYHSAPISYAAPAYAYHH